MSRWNPKLIKVHRDSADDLRTGESFHLRYQLGGRRLDMVAEVINCRRPAELSLRLRKPHDPRTSYVVETYELREVRGATQVNQEIDLARSGIPKWAQLLIWSVHKYGKPIGRSHLRRLAELAEQTGRSDR